MRMMKKSIVKFFNTLYYLCIPNEKKICINSCMSSRFGKIKHLNWGDDLNFYLVRELSGKIVLNNADLFNFRQLNIMVIGSIIDWMCNKRTIIWGSGAVWGDRKIDFPPYDVKAVRGKLTRKYLLEQGISCPEIYGDPALLLPLVYKPTIEKKYTMGIIPHYVDYNNEYVEEFKKKYGESVTIINLKQYNSWRDVIDNVCQCEFIASSSLHGIIVSDAYKIPNIWIRLSNKISGGNFKFHDYFSGVGRNLLPPIIINDFIDLEIMRSYVSSYTPINFSPSQLLESCPFHILSKYKR